jgi:hypothetical protein
MIDRRELLTLGGLLGLASSPHEAGTADGAAYGVGQMSDRYAQDAINALKSIGTAITQQQSFDAINPLRDRQVNYLKANNKFPDFIDVSVDVWIAVYDWHVRMQQPLVVGRDALGRYTMMLGFTALVLRPDVAPNFISTPYDNR